MRAALRFLPARRLPRGRADALRQIGLFALAYVTYQVARGLVDGRVATASWNATRIINVEHALHLFVEPSVQAWATSRHWLIGFADWMYLNAHLPGTIAALLFLYFRRTDSFYFVRNMLLAAMGIALVGYVFYPTAPPWLMPEWGFTDSITEFTGVQVDNTPLSALLNLYAAVPSMHVCFALLVTWPVARLVRPRPVRVLLYLYPLLVTFVVVATGNHYVFDALLGALTAWLSLRIARRLARVRPGAWAFGRAVAEAPA